MQMNQPNNDASIENDNNILISMSWKDNCDIDLWLLLPNGKKVFYNNRDEPPAHLDVDVVSWRKYDTESGSHVIKDNQEIISIRSIMPGEYAVNGHLFSSVYEGQVKVDVLIQDVKNHQVIYHGSMTLNSINRQQHFAKFTVTETDKNTYKVDNIYTDRPIFFVGNSATGEGF